MLAPSLCIYLQAITIELLEHCRNNNFEFSFLYLGAKGSKPFG